MMKIPVPFTHIAKMTDFQLVPKIKERIERETVEFFYGKAAPIFIKLFANYYTDCDNPVEFIDDFYAELMSVRESVNTRKIDGFAFDCQFKNWIGKIALIYCFDRFAINEKRKEMLVSYASMMPEPQLQQNISLLDKQDVNTLLSMMPNRNYSELIRSVYVEGRTLQETAAILNVPMDKFFNMHRRAKLQYTQIYNKEARL